MIVWLDDERPMPADFDTHVKTAYEAIELLKTGQVTEISLDHDLGDTFCRPSNCGYEVAKFIEEGAANNTLKRIRVWCHSQNPVGKQKIKQAIRKAHEFWSSYEN